jgi:hypothetical protein
MDGGISLHGKQPEQIAATALTTAGNVGAALLKGQETAKPTGFAKDGVAPVTKAASAVTSLSLHGDLPARITKLEAEIKEVESHLNTSHRPTLEKFWARQQALRTEAAHLRVAEIGSRYSHGVGSLDQRIASIVRERSELQALYNSTSLNYESKTYWPRLSDLHVAETDLHIESIASKYQHQTGPEALKAQISELKAMYGKSSLVPVSNRYWARIDKLQAKLDNGTIESIAAKHHNLPVAKPEPAKTEPAKSELVPVTRATRPSIGMQVVGAVSVASAALQGYAAYRSMQKGNTAAAWAHAVSAVGQGMVATPALSGRLAAAGTPGLVIGTCGAIAASALDR